MHIDWMELRNFRSFMEREFTFGGGFNVLAGENGSGKSTILDALALGIQYCLWGMHQAPQPTIRDADDRLVAHRFGEEVRLEPQHPVTLRWHGSIAGTKFDFRIGDTAFVMELVRAGHTAQLPDVLPGKLADAVANGERMTLPVLAYYRTGRLWRQEQHGNSVESLAAGSRLRGYEGCLSPSTDPAGLLSAFKTAELIALQERKIPFALAAMRSAAQSCVEGCTDVRFHVRHGQLRATFEDGRVLPFEALSDGVRGMLALVVDLAWRCAELNPHLGKLARHQTPGLVLIDEIDLHLHPRWQRRVVDDLRQTFPKVQFVVTTHSPFILQSLKPGELMNLDRSTELPGESIEDITEHVMGVAQPQRSKRHHDLVAAATRYYAALDGTERVTGRELARRQRGLEQALSTFADNPAAAALLRLEYAARVGRTGKAKAHRRKAGAGGKKARTRRSARASQGSDETN